MISIASLIPNTAPEPTKKSAPAAPVPSTLLGYCRAGFEDEVVAEWAALAGVRPQTVEPSANLGYAVATFPVSAARGVANVLRNQSMFSRTVIDSYGEPVALGLRDRIGPICEAVEVFFTQRNIGKVSAVWIEFPDTNEGKTLSPLAIGLQVRLTEALSLAGRITTAPSLRLHVFMLTKQLARIGVCDPDAASASIWPLGIPRLRIPKDAPSRSTAKLAEAIHYFFGDDDERLLQPEMRAVDLGAAPGGWTWQLVHRGIKVMAVDNGAMKGEMADNAMVHHLREDGFRFVPKKAVDWMVCDIVDSPSRIATLVGRWLKEGWTRHTIFNLKLPMKKRIEEVERCRAIIEDALGERRSRYDLRFKHLFHDREEITVYCGLMSRAPSKTPTKTPGKPTGKATPKPIGPQRGRRLPPIKHDHSD